MLASYSADFRPSSQLPKNRVDVTAADDAASPPLVVQTLAELVEMDANPAFVVPSFCQQLDLLLGGGGIAAGTLVEFCGAPGTGKTQLGLQFAVAASLPRAFGGPEGSALIVDTEGSFVPGRFREVAAAAAAHVQLVANHQQQSDMGDDLRSAAAEYTVDTIMQRTLVERIVDLTGLVAFITALPSILQIRGNIRVLVVDSIAFPFRAAEDQPEDSLSPWDATARRTRLALYCARELERVAREKNVAVVVTNQVQQVRVPRTGELKVSPALGDAWQHAIPNRFMVTVNCAGGDLLNPKRRVTTIKSSRGLPGDACELAVTAAGIRDVPGAV